MHLHLTLSHNDQMTLQIKVKLFLITEYYLAYCSPTDESTCISSYHTTVTPKDNAWGKRKENTHGDLCVCVCVMLAELGEKS